MQLNVSRASPANKASHLALMKTCVQRNTLLRGFPHEYTGNPSSPTLVLLVPEGTARELCDSALKLGYWNVGEANAHRTVICPRAWFMEAGIALPQRPAMIALPSEVVEQLHALRTAVNRVEAQHEKEGLVDSALVKVVVDGCRAVPVALHAHMPELCAILEQTRDYPAMSNPIVSGWSERLGSEIHGLLSGPMPQGPEKEGPNC